MQLTKEQEDIARNALIKYGVDSQVDMCIEECSELINALEKHRRRRVDFREVCTEIADVFITISQMQMVFGAKEVDNQIEYKTNRLKERIENEIHRN